MFRTLVIGAIALAGCKQQPSKLETVGGPGAATPSSPSQPSHPVTEGEISGTVVETKDASEYTYVRLDHDGTEVWLAGPQTTLAVGTKIGPISGTAMPGFHSDTLNKTFDQIYFVTSFGGAGTPPAAAKPVERTAPPAAGTPELSGVVTETMDAGGYTYAHLDREGTQLWVAGPTTKLVVGSKLGKMTGTLMEQFRSETLKRTFDQIYFVNSYIVAAGAIPNPHTNTGSGSGSGAPPAATTAAIEKIKPPPGGTTVAAVFAGKDTLVGKPVVLRGKITKITNGVLGRNWLHVQDGSGITGTNDLLVTTQATTTVGDVVTVKGTVATKQDFGAGYKYDVIVENATIEK